MESKKNRTSNLEKIQKTKTPSEVDDAANVTLKYPNKKKEYRIEDKKPSFPPIDYEKPPHY